jgi:Zn-dependent M28 family amino/carboxypeptidase
MDHVGVGAPDASGDSIYNGADDNASGTAAVLEIARAMAALKVPPKRSAVFLVVSGEEKGLWGSAYYADHPTVDMAQVVANLNTDMVARNWPDTIVAIGKSFSDLGATLDRVSSAHPELHITAVDDRWPDQNYFRRSDHFNFARKGVPALALYDGNQEDYHQPGDDVGKFDGDKGSRMAKLTFYLSLEIANATQRPQWDPERYQEIVTGGGG